MPLLHRLFVCLVGFGAELCTPAGAALASSGSAARRPCSHWLRRARCRQSNDPSSVQHRAVRGDYARDPASDVICRKQTICPNSELTARPTVRSKLLFMVALWDIFSLWFLSIFLYFPRLISAAADWMSTILRHMVWPYSANLECRSEMCCARLAGNAGPKKLPKSRHLGTIAQICRAIRL